MDLLHTISLSAGLAWASGIRLYAVCFFAGLLAHFHWLTLPEGLVVLSNPWVLGLAGVLFVVEFLADKIPAVDSVWDAVHTFIRIPAGAVLAAAALGHDANPMAIAIAVLLGGTLAATSHVTKASTRLAVNASPEPFSNVAISGAEGALVAFGMWLSALHPIVFFVFLSASLFVSIWVIVKLSLFFRRTLARLFRREKSVAPAADEG